MRFWERNVPDKGKGKSSGEAKALLKERSGNEGKWKEIMPQRCQQLAYVGNHGKNEDITFFPV